MPGGKLLAVDFERRAREGRVHSVCFALGEEPLLHDLVETAARNLPDESTRDFNLDVLHGDGLAAGDLAAALSALPMMDNRRVVVVKHAESITPTVQKYLLEYVSNPSDSTLLVLLARSDGKPAWIKKLVAKTEVIDCMTPRGRALATWAVNQAREFGVQIDDDALALLSEAGSQLLDLKGELLKASLLLEEGGTITLLVLQQVWGIEAEVNIWQFFDLVASGNRMDALRAIELMSEHLDKDSGFFMSQIARRWRLVSKERAYDARRVPQGQRLWHANTKRQWSMASPEVRALPYAFAEKQLERLRDLDRQRKSTSHDAVAGFATLVHRISLDRKEGHA